MPDRISHYYKNPEACNGGKNFKKSTRGDGLKAYNEMRARIKEEKEPEPYQTKIFETEQKLVATALQSSDDEIVKSITDIKLQLSKALDTIAEKRLEEYKKLVEIEKAVSIESKKLEELYEISRSAETLTALMRTQEEQRRIFDEEMSETRENWDKERETIEEQIKENKTRIEKERKQENEDYDYRTAKKRQAETDAYETKKAALEKELAGKKESFEKEFGARAEVIKAQESEYKQLKDKVAAFPAELEKTIKETEKTIREKIEVQYKHQSEMLKMEIEGERKLHQQLVAALQTKIQEKDALIAQLTQKTNDSSQQVQDIALKAIDGASKLRVIREYSEKERGPEKQ